MNTQRVADRLRVMRTLWGALCFTAVIFPGLLVLTGHSLPGPREPDAVMVYALAAMSCVMTAMSLVFPRVIYTRGAKAAAEGLFREDREAVDAGQHGFREVASSVLVRNFTDPEAAEAAAFRLHQTRLILELALAEAVSNFGFILGFLGLGVVRVMPFFVVALSLQLARFPTRGRVRSAFEEATGARFAGPRIE